MAETSSQNDSSFPAVVRQRMADDRRKALYATIVFVVVVAIISAIAFHHAISKSTAQIQIMSNGFKPQVLQIERGATVKWINDDSQAHRLSAEPYPLNNSIPGFNSNVVLQPHESYNFRFAHPGTYRYYDYQQRDSLKGTVVVK